MHLVATSRRPRRTLAATAMAVILALTGTACTSDDKPAENLPSAPNDSISGEGAVSGHRLTVAAGGDIAVSISKPEATQRAAAALNDLAESGLLVGSPLEVSAAKIPGRGIQLTRTYPIPLPKNSTASLAFFNPRLGSWQAVPSDVAADRRSVTARVDHLSLWTDIVSGTQEALGTVVDAVSDAGQVVGEALVDGAEWVYNAVSTVFDTRAPAPKCKGDTPDWVDTTPSIEPDKNNPIHFCVGSDPKQPDLLVVKAVVNRGYAFSASAAAASTWQFNHSFSSREATMLADLILKQDALVAQLVELTNLGPSTVSAGFGIDYGFSEAEVRKVPSGRPLVTLDPPKNAVAFLTSVLANLLGTYARDWFSGWAAAVTTVGTCLRDLNNTDDVFGAAKTLLSCLTTVAEHSVVPKLADLLNKRRAAGEQAGNLKVDASKAGKLVGRATVILGTLGPVLSTLNYIAERNTDASVRSLTVFPTRIDVTKLIDFRTTQFPVGPEMTDPGMVSQLRGAPASFKKLIAREIESTRSNGANYCPGAFQGVFVQQMRTGPNGVAIGGINTCGGAAVLWAYTGGRWKNVFATQDSWDCDILRRYKVPSAFVGDSCYSYAEQREYPYNVA